MVNDYSSLQWKRHLAGGNRKFLASPGMTKNNNMKIINTFAAVLFTLLFHTATGQEYSTRSGSAIFRVNAPARMIEGQSREVSIRINGHTGAVSLEVPITSFGFSNNFVSDTMNTKIRERFNSYYMESGHYPGIAYRGLILDAGTVRYTKDGRYPIHTKGTLHMHGESREVITEGEVIVKGRNISISAHTVIKPHDYLIRIPSYIGDLYFGEVAVDVHASLSQ